MMKYIYHRAVNPGDDSHIITGNITITARIYAQGIKRGDIMTRFYSIRAIEDFIAKHCVDCLYSSDSVVGLGNQIWTMDNGRFFIIKEVFLNCWSSGHQIRQVSKLSKKQLSLIDDEKSNILLQDE